MVCEIGGEQCRGFLELLIYLFLSSQMLETSLVPSAISAPISMEGSHPIPVDGSYPIPAISTIQWIAHSGSPWIVQSPLGIACTSLTDESCGGQISISSFLGIEHTLMGIPGGHTLSLYGVYAVGAGLILPQPLMAQNVTGESGRPACLALPSRP
jgi:hypothetical protein